MTEISGKNGTLKNNTETFGNDGLGHELEARRNFSEMHNIPEIMNYE